jgi:hypothetical protein
MQSRAGLAALACLLVVASGCVVPVPIPEGTVTVTETATANPTAAGGVAVGGTPSAAHASATTSHAATASSSAPTRAPANSTWLDGPAGSPLDPDCAPDGNERSGIQSIDGQRTLFLPNDGCAAAFAVGTLPAGPFVATFRYQTTGQQGTLCGSFELGGRLVGTTPRTCGPNDAWTLAAAPATLGDATAALTVTWRTDGLAGHANAYLASIRIDPAPVREAAIAGADGTPVNPDCAPDNRDERTGIQQVGNQTVMFLPSDGCAVDYRPGTLPAGSVAVALRYLTSGQEGTICGSFELGGRLVGATPRTCGPNGAWTDAVANATQGEGGAALRVTWRTDGLGGYANAFLSGLRVTGPVGPQALWEGRLAGWSVQGRGASVDCALRLEGACTLRLASPDNVGVTVRKDLAVPLGAPTTFAWSFQADGTYGDSDGNVLLAFADGSGMRVHYTEGVGLNTGVLLQVGDASTGAFCHWPSAHAWYRATLALDGAAHTASVQVWAPDGTLVGTSPELALPPAAGAVTALTLQAVFWGGTADTFHLGGIVVD